MRTLSRSTTTRTLVGVVATSALLLGAAPTATAGTSSATATTVATTTPSAAAYTASAADRRIASMLTARVTTARFGTAFTGAVLDAGSDTTIWSKNGDTGYMPASTTKLVTASNALSLLGPDTQLTTRIRSGSTKNRVIVEGAGDPSVTSAQLDSLASRTAAWLRAQTITYARVYVDDDIFPTPTLAPGWKQSYVPASIAPVRGLVRDQIANSDTSAEAARYYAVRLKAHGIATVGYYGRLDATAGSTVITSRMGAPLSTSVSRMLLNSDNEIAESLHKLVGVKLGQGATWTGARAAQTKQLTAQGLKATALYDGSGLSRSDRLSALQLARVMDRGLDARYRATLWPLQSAQAMPTAGRTGTLTSRFTTAASKCAVGKVWAKTGTLNDVVSLAGFTQGTDGRVKVFAFVVNGKSSTTTLKQNIDMLAATVNGCY